VRPRISLTFPRPKSPAPEPFDRRNPAANGSARESLAARVSKRILLVEDDYEIREVMRVLLVGEGYEVTVAANGREALERLSPPIASDAPDVIILDLLMPVMDGWQFLAARRGTPAIAAIPVVVMTADRKAKVDAIDVQASLPKPFSVTVLIETLSRML